MVLSLRPEAEADLSESYGYYEDCRRGLGDDFLLCVEETFERIARNPRQCPAVHPEVRRTLVHRFPYGIFYVLVETKVIVIAVLDAARDPQQWRSRI